MPERLDPNALEAAELFAGFAPHTHAAQHLHAVCAEVRACWRELADVRPLLDGYATYLERCHVAVFAMHVLPFNRWVACHFLYEYERTKHAPDVLMITQMEQVLLLGDGVMHG
jgi:hypothetical protein